MIIDLCIKLNYFSSFYSILNPDQPYKVFDMKKFQQNMSRELKRSSPDRLKLENQCISAIAFGSSDTEEEEEEHDNR